MLINYLENLINLWRWKNRRSIFNNSIQSLTQLYNQKKHNTVFDQAESLFKTLPKRQDIRELLIIRAKNYKLLGDFENALLAWQDLYQWFPEYPEAAKELYTAIRTVHGDDQAHKFYSKAMHNTNNSIEQYLSSGLLAETKQNFVLAEELLNKAFDIATELQEKQNITSHMLGLYYERQGYVNYAYYYLKMASRYYPKKKSLHNKLAKLQQQFKLLDIDPKEYEDTLSETKLLGQNLIFTKLFNLIKTNSKLNTQAKQGHVVLINRSLGSGGAERQFVSTIKGLRNHDNITELTVICRDLQEKQGDDFFLPEIQALDIQPLEYQKLPIDKKIPELEIYNELLECLKPGLYKPIYKLYNWFMQNNPQVVHAWQDTTNIIVGIAALMAGVPKIILGTRSMPPYTKKKDKDYYLIVYKYLLEYSHIHMVNNSQTGASTYADWLNVDLNKINVIYNGYETNRDKLLEAHTSQVVSAESKYQEFITQNNLKYIIGTVIRFDENKRPLFWVEIASKIIAQHKDTGCIMVGQGELFTQTQQLAESLNIADKILFIGRSNIVDFWMKKFDIFLLTSIIEGLPNVLIEAQLNGTFVVSTPAGGAGDTFQNNITGHLIASDSISNTDNVSIDICNILTKINNNVNYLEEKQVLAKEFACNKFALNTMYQNTIDNYFS